MERAPARGNTSIVLSRCPVLRFVGWMNVPSRRFSRRFVVPRARARLNCRVLMRLLGPTFGLPRSRIRTTPPQTPSYSRRSGWMLAPSNGISSSRSTQRSFVSSRERRRIDGTAQFDFRSKAKEASPIVSSVLRTFRAAGSFSPVFGDESTRDRGRGGRKPRTVRSTWWPVAHPGGPCERASLRAPVHVLVFRDVALGVAGGKWQE